MKKQIKNIIQGTKKFIGAAAITTAIVVAGQNNAKAQSAESFTTKNQTSIDVKASGQISDKVGFFTRHIPTYNFETGTSYFGLVDLTYHLGKGFAGVAEVQAMSGSKPTPRVGAQMYKEKGPVSLYILTTSSIQKNPNLELLTNLTYAPKLNEKLKGDFRLETVTDIGEEGHQFTIAKARAGVTKDKLSAGLGLDTFTDKTGSTYSPGVYLKLNF